MSIYQTKHFPYFSRVREERSQNALDSYMNYRGLDPKEYLDDVMRIISEDGPILSSQIKLGESIINKWGSSKPSSAALDYLFHKGMIGRILFRGQIIDFHIMIFFPSINPEYIFLFKFISPLLFQFYCLEDERGDGRRQDK